VTGVGEKWWIIQGESAELGLADRNANELSDRKSGGRNKGNNVKVKL
jgi:hypothetical protein